MFVDYEYPPILSGITHKCKYAKMRALLLLPYNLYVYLISCNTLYLSMLLKTQYLNLSNA